MGKACTLAFTPHLTGRAPWTSCSLPEPRFPYLQNADSSTSPVVCSESEGKNEVMEAKHSPCCVPVRGCLKSVSRE